MTHGFREEASKIVKPKKKARQKVDGTLKEKEGLIFISFVYGGKKFKQSHQLTDFELKQLKHLMENSGEDASKSVISKTAIQNTAIMAENVLALAFLDYIRTHYHDPSPLQQGTVKEAIEQMKKELGTGSGVGIDPDAGKANGEV